MPSKLSERTRKFTPCGGDEATGSITSRNRIPVTGSSKYVFQRRRNKIMNATNSPKAVHKHPLLDRDEIEKTGRVGSGSGKSDDEIAKEMRTFLGEGPLRFGPVRQERTVRSQLLLLSSGKGVNAFAELKAKWEMEWSGKSQKFTDLQMLRALRFTKWDVDKAYQILRRCNPDHFYITMMDVEEQLKTKTVVPIPQLRTQRGSSVVYFRPARYRPKEQPTYEIIENLIYVLENLMIEDPDYKRGISMIFDLQGWTMVNFNRDYWSRLFRVLQGRVFPARINLLLFINIPTWFERTWSITRSMLQDKFKARTFFLDSTSELKNFLMDGYKDYLPDDIEGGTASTQDMTHDYILYQKFLDKATGKSDAQRPVGEEENNITRRFRSWSRGRNDSSSHNRSSHRRSVSRDKSQHNRSSASRDNNSSSHNRSQHRRSLSRDKSKPVSPAKERRRVRRPSIPNTQSEPGVPRRRNSFSKMYASSSQGGLSQKIKTFLTPSPARSGASKRTGLMAKLRKKHPVDNSRSSNQREQVHSAAEIPTPSSSASRRSSRRTMDGGTPRGSRETQQRSMSSGRNMVEELNPQSLGTDVDVEDESPFGMSYTSLPDNLPM